MNAATRTRITESLLRESRQMYPNLPDHVRVISKPKEGSTNELTKTVINYLRAEGWQAERINTTGRPLDQRKEVTDVIGHIRTIGSVKWIPSTTTKGSADISATIKGRSVKIEIKYSKDRQSDQQIKYQSDVERAGGVYWLVRDLDSFMEQYDQI